MQVNAPVGGALIELLQLTRERRVPMWDRATGTSNLAQAHAL